MTSRTAAILHLCCLAGGISCSILNSEKHIQQEAARDDSGAQGRTCTHRDGCCKISSSHGPGFGGSGINRRRGAAMPFFKKSLIGEQPPATAHPPKPPATRASEHPPLMPAPKPRAAGPGMTWVNLTREIVEEKLSRYQRQHGATHQQSLWERLANALRKSRKSA